MDRFNLTRELSIALGVLRLLLVLGLCGSSCETLWARTSANDSDDDTAQSTAASRRPPAEGLLLVTLDTTRADALGVYTDRAPGTRSPTPVLDALAARGVRYRRAVTSAPLTLPAHASLLTGRTPPGHGVHDNATDALPASVPTLATILKARGFETAAIVGSRVLDRRFGLARGFDLYQDRPPAEQVGEHGYAERTAEDVTALALDWLATRPRDRPFFLWVHYYDPHAPYEPPDLPASASEASRYAGEVRLCDREVGRLLAALPSTTLVAVAGDHGESLGEHDEDTHGLFLYRGVLEVPLLLAGPKVPNGRVVEEPVASRRLAASLLGLLGQEAGLPGPVLPGLDLLTDQASGQGEKKPQPTDILASGLIYSETILPATAYGWSPLHAVTGPRYRLVMAPRPELYDVEADPAESENLIREMRADARRLKAALDRHLELRIEGQTAELDAEMRRELAQLGYLSGSSDAGSGDRLDPKDGLGLLRRFDEAKALQGRGQLAQALDIFEDLVRKNPQNGPFLTHLASARLENGQVERGLELYRQAVAQRPDHELTRYQLALQLDRHGRTTEAQAELEKVLELDPRFADAWLALAQQAYRRGEPAEERRLLESAVAAGTSSAGLFLRLGQLRQSLPEPDLAGAAEALHQATDLAPRWPLAWLMRGQLHQERGEGAEARSCFEHVLQIAPPSSTEASQARDLLRR